MVKASLGAKKHPLPRKRKTIFQTKKLAVLRLVSSVRSPKLTRVTRWGLLLLTIVLLLLWNWKLLLATTTGVGLMLFVYLLQGSHGQLYWLRGKKFFSHIHGKFILAVGSGGLGALSTYMAASIWAESENRWLATGSILQGMGTITTIGLLLWQITIYPMKQDEAKFEKLLTELTDTEPLKRMIAVRKLTHLISCEGLEATDHHQLREYFRLMLTQEKEPLIRNALLESLQLWGDKQTNHSQQALKIPVKLTTIAKVEDYHN